MKTETLNDVTIDWHDSHIPEFAEAEINRLYGTLYASMAWQRLMGIPSDVHTYVVRRAGTVTALLLCQFQGTQLNVITESIALPAEELQRFVDYAFDRFPQVSALFLNSIAADARIIQRPQQNFWFSEDIIVTLPDSEETYLSMLGSSTRKNVKRHMNRLKRDFPSFEFKCMPATDASDAVLREIILFNHARMSVKNKVSAIDDKEAQTIIAMARECGHVYTATIDGKLCAGAITYSFGDHVVSRISAHDPAYDDYRLGMTCCFLTVCAAIKRGARFFHFMWGQYDYKTALLGVQQDQFRIVIYRSRVHALRHPKLALATAYHAGKLESKRWLLAKSKEHTPLARAINKAVEQLKHLKHLFVFRRLRANLAARPVTNLAES